ncbi:hypothetical protein BRPE64_ACDS25490 [Caballeronia insecticola]|uniref:Uncharacterized protein n=1 Tax=Caballeronia insecticola TaxID=758793 RepID=R4WIU2_9BURK|nr:hypothetical protein BRPE64_ACDS25490 [Caballeronia insecticola]
MTRDVAAVKSAVSSDPHSRSFASRCTTRRHECLYGETADWMPVFHRKTKKNRQRDAWRLSSGTL